MAKKKWIKRYKTWHRWPAIVISFFAFLFAFSGVIMNHRDWFSGIDLPRTLLPSNYSYKNWNLSGVRGGEIISNDSILIYGNIGIWQTDSDFNTFSDFNTGFPKGIDNRKIASLKKWKDQLVAGTYFGVFRSDEKQDSWQKIPLPVTNQRISDLTIKNDTLIILTRNYLIRTSDLSHFSVHTLPPPPGYVKNTGLFNTLWELHSGELFGVIGKLIVDLLGLVTIFLSITGLLHFMFPKLIKRKKKRGKSYSGLLFTKKLNIRWHNAVGYLFIIFLVINTIAGMFLRPPLLIPIMNSQVGILPGTHLDTPNPWHDKLRKIVCSDDGNDYIISTTDGFFRCDAAFKKMEIIPNQPPVSIMGCNVLKKLTHDEFLVGSFSGMYIWNPDAGVSEDYFTGKTYQKPEGMARPVSEHMVAGIIENSAGSMLYFDYNAGTIPLIGRQTFGSMTDEIIEKSPISLWNTALEMHTGRIFESILGLFYMLYVPFSGICLLLVLISGFLLWYKAFR